MIRALSALAVLLLFVPKAISQELDASQLSQHADTVRQGVLVDKVLRRDGQRSSNTSRARAKATCANKGRAAALHGAGHPKVQQLYRLCERAGF